MLYYIIYQKSFKLFYDIVI